MDLQGKKILFLGDSITAGGGASAEAFGFVDLVAHDLGAHGVNYGISATRIAPQHALPDDTSHFCARALQMDPDADVVIVFGGTNDFGHGDAPLGTPADREPTTFYGAVHTLFRSLSERYLHAQIVVLTPLRRANEDNPRGDGNKPQDVAPLKIYADILRNVAEEYALPVLDLFRHSGIQPKIPAVREAFMPDGLHPNDAGHRLLADRIIAFLRAL